MPIAVPDYLQPIPLVGAGLRPARPSSGLPPVRLLSGHVDILAAALPSEAAFDCVLVEAGPNLNGWTIPNNVLALAAPLFAGAPCLIDHPGFLDFPSLRNLAGTFEDPAYFEDATGAHVSAALRLANSEAGNTLRDLFSAWLLDLDAGLQVPPVGLSAVLSVEMDYNESSATRVCSKITKVWSVDAVLHPAAGGRVERVLNSAFPDRRTFPFAGSATCLHPALWGRRQAATASCPSPGGLNLGGSHIMPDNLLPDQQPANAQNPQGSASSPTESRDPLAAIMERMEHISQRIDALTPPPCPPGQARSPEPESVGELQDLSAIHALTQRVDFLEEHIALANNPIRDVGPVATVDGSTLRAGPSGLEQVELAFDALLAGIRPPGGIQPLTGIREAYNLLSGDFEMTGVFNPDRVYLANVTCSTMASMVANALNKRVMVAFQSYPHWWDAIATVEEFNTLQDVRWITLGGVGELPTVSEGASYSELTWDDNYQSDSFVKKGGYLGLTIEAIDKDDTGKLRTAPRALAQAAWLTLSKSVSAVFTSNAGVGPTINIDASTTRALFHASNSNLGSSALSFASYVATRTAMRQQTELNSGERLGALTAPKYLLVPPDLEITALQILASAGEPGTADNDINPLAAGNSHNALLESARRRVIVVDLWTDTDNWAAVADPMMYPSIGLAYRYGRVPEIFSVASPSAGLMFTNDTMPVKVRYFYAVGPIDYRGLYKHNV